ncbi:MAG: RnfABCDGE type electron transport complex subunit G [Lachnospiraceae bacterium]|jgi:electron transport complex protein RnfG|nr:RnfABCDGE type electron transport complex subunit G [Lachnospiraceae bacterium]
MKKIIKNTLILTMITLIAGICLGFVYQITKDPIAKAEDAAKRAAWQEVFPKASASDFKEEKLDTKAAKSAIKKMDVNAEIDEVVAVAGGKTGYIITTTDKDGYGGDIKITVGITADKKVSGISILSISETAGLGMRATEPSFYNQYKDKSATEKFVVQKDYSGSGQAIDQLSGATITSRAVTGAVNAAVGYYEKALAK